MRARALVVCELLAVGVAAGLSPLDYVSTYVFGSPALADTGSTRQRPIDDVAHVECAMRLDGCQPAAGCHMPFPGNCQPRIGHYWVAGPPPPPPALLSAVLPPVKPPYRMMTSRGVLTIRPHFGFTQFGLVDEPEDVRPPLYQLPGMHVLSWIMLYISLPGAVLFYASIAMRLW